MHLVEPSDGQEVNIRLKRRFKVADLAPEEGHLFVIAHVDLDLCAGSNRVEQQELGVGHHLQADGEVVGAIQRLINLDSGDIGAILGLHAFGVSSDLCVAIKLDVDTQKMLAALRHVSSSRRDSPRLGGAYLMMGGTKSLMPGFKLIGSSIPLVSAMRRHSRGSSYSTVAMP